MKKQNKCLFIIATVLAVFNMLLFFAIRPMWSGVILYAGHPAPYIIMAIIILMCICAGIFIYRRRHPLVIGIIFTTAGVFFLALESYIIALTTEAYLYFIREFLYGLLYLGIIAVLTIIIYIFPKCRAFHCTWLRPVIVIALFCGLLIWYFKLVPNAITSTPVVYAVNDEYQIVFTSRAKGTGWVTVNGQEYNDTYSGYRMTESTVHKISVPMSVLDEAGGYTIYTKSMLLRGPYCALQGSTLSETYDFRSVDSSDGVNYYVLSDTHNDVSVPISTATYFGDDLDFVIFCGDAVSWVDRTSDLTNVLDLLGGITGGEVPVVYARGNHETKGVKAHELYRYVACDGDKFYYTFRLGNVWGVVLDTGEDHADDYIEYYGAAKFTDYRMEQAAFLDEIIADSENEYNAEGVDTRIVVAHIPIAYKYKNDYAGEAKDAWIERLNQMNITMCYGGHVHELQYIEPYFEEGSTLTQCYEYSGKETGNSSRYMTAAEFPEILVSRKSEGQQLTYPEIDLGWCFIGLAVTSDGTSTTMRYTNEKHKVINNIVSPWFSNITYGSSITVMN